MAVKKGKKDKKKGGGSKLSRTEVVTVRFDPKLRYLLELGARKHRRTVSSFIEWAVERALKDVYVETGGGKSKSLLSQQDSFWDVDAADRLVKLAINAPSLLTYNEERAWKLINEDMRIRYWKGKEIRMDRIREDWRSIIEVAPDLGDED